GKGGGGRAGGGERRWGEAGRAPGGGGVLRRGDRLEARHDAPPGAEQADERPRRAAGGEHQEAALQAFALARDRHFHHLLDAHLQAGERTRLDFEAALPLAHGGDEQRRHGMARPRRERAIEFFERLARPEGLFEAVHGGAGARVEHRLVDRDRPHPDPGDEQAEEQLLDDDVRRPEQAEDRQIRGSERRHQRRDFGGIHGSNILSARSSRDGCHPRDHDGRPSRIARCLARRSEIREIVSRPPTGTAPDSAPNLSKLGHLPRPSALAGSMRVNAALPGERSLSFGQRDYASERPATALPSNTDVPPSPGKSTANAFGWERAAFSSLAPEGRRMG